MGIQEVSIQGRILPWNVTEATSYAKWLNIYDINSFISDFDPANPTQLTIVLDGSVNEPCPAQWLYSYPSGTYCEYAFHGRQSQFSCCPVGFTGTSPAPVTNTCGCRDDLDQTPYRMGYALDTQSSASSTFVFDIALVPSAFQIDYDGFDLDNGTAVNCSAMPITNIKLNVFSSVQVTSVSFNGALYDFQFTPSGSPYSNWLWILGVDYTVADFTPFQPLNVTITVAGWVSELCPASNYYGSQSSCEYVIVGPSADSGQFDGCCPRGVTAFTTLPRLQALGGVAIGSWLSA